MTRIAGAVLVGGLIVGAASADDEQARLLLDQAHREALDARADRARAEELRRASLVHTEEAYVHARGGPSELWALTLLGWRAFDAGEFGRAEAYATRTLILADELAGEHVFSIGNAIHHANLVLGSLALRDGDLDGAGKHLLAAGRTPGSPQLDTFGPNMSLVRPMLERGEREVVLQYFELCGRFWRLGVEDGTLDRWARTVERGGTPDFGANLVYGR
jgi:hypothetical protein